jgi:hypothetical protein
MSSDFGVKKPKRSNPIALIVPLLVVVLLIGAGGAMWMMQQKSKAAEAASWHMAGPPCPTATPSEFAAATSGSESHAVEIDGAKMTRTSGEANCGEAPNVDGGAAIPVCKFTDPTTLDVTVGGDHFYFLPHSDPATVSIVGGKPVCALRAAATS